MRVHGERAGDGDALLLAAGKLTRKCERAVLESDFAEENVALVTEISDSPMAPDEALALVNLGPRSDHFPAQLSGGEQQRVAIARAIAKRPSVLLCDEPTGALDISTGVVVLDALQRVNAELGTTTVVITHNAAIAQMADRVIRLADGRIVSVEDRTSKLSPHQLEW